jgi:hypothetical protein
MSRCSPCSQFQEQQLQEMSVKVSPETTTCQCCMRLSCIQKPCIRLWTSFVTLFRPCFLSDLQWAWRILNAPFRSSEYRLTLGFYLLPPLIMCSKAQDSIRSITDHPNLSGWIRWTSHDKTGRGKHWKLTRIIKLNRSACIFLSYSSLSNFCALCIPNR